MARMLRRVYSTGLQGRANINTCKAETRCRRARPVALQVLTPGARVWLAEEDKVGQWLMANRRCEH